MRQAPQLDRNCIPKGFSALGSTNNLVSALSATTALKVSRVYMLASCAKNTWNGDTARMTAAVSPITGPDKRLPMR